jgi:hypothetical protein
MDWHPAMAAIPQLPPPPRREATYYLDVKRQSVEAAANEVRLAGDWVQYGVYDGYTAGHLLRYLPPDAELVLLDSFQGLPTDWLPGFPAGTFALDIPPTFADDRARVIPGLFADTAADALRGRDLALMHIDCDLYRSTLDALHSCGTLRAGTVLLFDEYVHEIDGVRSDDEHRALTEWAEQTGHAYTYLWRTTWTQVCVSITRSPAHA